MKKLAISAVTACLLPGLTPAVSIAETTGGTGGCEVQPGEFREYYPTFFRRYELINRHLCHHYEEVKQAAIAVILETNVKSKEAMTHRFFEKGGTFEQALEEAEENGRAALDYVQYVLTNYDPSVYPTITQLARSIGDDIPRARAFMDSDFTHALNEDVRLGDKLKKRQAELNQQDREFVARLASVAVGSYEREAAKTAVAEGDAGIEKFFASTWIEGARRDRYQDYVRITQLDIEIDREVEALLVETEGLKAALVKLSGAERELAKARILDKYAEAEKQATQGLSSWETDHAAHKEQITRWEKVALVAKENSSRQNWSSLKAAIGIQQDLWASQIKIVESNKVRYSELLCTIKSKASEVK